MRIKLDAYQFQKYGIAEGAVRTVSADSSQSGSKQIAASAIAPAATEFRPFVRR